MRSAWFARLALAWVTGCGPGAANNGASASAATGSSTGAPVSTGSTAGATSEDEPNGGDFVGTHDVGSGDLECDHWLQDCPEGFKCMPWANDGGNAWNALKCTPLDPNPDGLYETCLVQESGVSGVDSCELGTMCWDVDPETGEGHCVAICQGDYSEPLCEDPDAVCFIGADAVLSLCLPQCDPFAQDCLPGQGCYPLYIGFICVPDASGSDAGGPGDTCEFVNDCDPGQVCTNAASVLGCAGAQGCCSPVCEVGHPGADQTCPGAPAERCVPWFAPDSTPPGFANAGVCAIPEAG